MGGNDCYHPFCRKEATRTPDPYVPNVVRYQLRYFPFASAKLVHGERKNKFLFMFFLGDI